jgi:metallo-beta-lactamase family protein
VNATGIYRVHPECYNERVYQQFLDHHKNPFGFEQVRYITDLGQSKQLNDRAMPCIIIASSGMCEGGRILHHLKHNVTNPANTILVVGFMAEGTLGRRIADRAPIINIFGAPYPLKARVKILNTFSGHADYHDLCDYLLPVNKKRLRGVYLIHGEMDALTHLKEQFEQQGVRHVHIPREGETLTLD